MKKNLTIIGLVGATLLLLSCTPDELHVENQQNKNFESETIENQSIKNETLDKEEHFYYDEDGNPLNPKDKG
jgi:hypothetical protein